jgi:hypothetical protein
VPDAWPSSPRSAEHPARWHKFRHPQRNGPPTSRLPADLLAVVHSTKGYRNELDHQRLAVRGR